MQNSREHEKYTIIYKCNIQFASCNKQVLIWWHQGENYINIRD